MARKRCSGCTDYAVFNIDGAAGGYACPVHLGIFIMGAVLEGYENKFEVRMLDNHELEEVADGTQD
jgi:hypothetical protein